MALPAGYVWGPRRSPEQLWSVDPRADITNFCLTVGLALVLAIPPIASALGIAPFVAAGIVLTYTIHPVVGFLFRGRIRQQVRFFQVRVLVDLIHGVGIVSALVAATGDPLTPLWSLSVMYAALDGGDYDFPPSVVQLSTHTLGPLLSIPVFFAAHAPPVMALGVPLFFAAFSFVAYATMARRTAGVRTSFAERDAVRARVAEERTAIERESLIKSLSGAIEAATYAARTTRANARETDAAVARASRQSLAELHATMEALEAPAPPAQATLPEEHDPLYRPMPTFANADARSRPSWLAARFGLPLATALPIAFVMAIPLASLDPTSPLWTLAVFYATVDGSNYDVEASWLHLALHCGLPLATIPFFLYVGAPTGAAIGGPVFFAFTCFMPFHFGASRARVVREARAEHVRLEAELARMRADRERERLARDLHDTVGANLSLAALYADLLAEHDTDRERAQHFSTALEHATSQGLDDLRVLVEGLAFEAIDLTSLADLLRARVARIASAAGVTIDVRASGKAALHAAAHNALIRIAHEATSNAIRHGHATRVDIELLAEANDVVLRVSDDGRGFDATSETTGRGLANMRTRTAELDGLLDVTSGKDGTRITARIPQERR